MRIPRGGVTAIAVSVAVAGACLFTSAPASAQPVGTGTVSFTGDPGDYIAGGQTYSYDTSTGDRLGVNGSSDERAIEVSVTGANGDWWYLDLAAPTGEALAAGTYAGATRFGGTGQPAIDIFGDGRGCNETSGSFTINSIEWGPYGYVQAIDATYEQHCEGWDPALRGNMHITNPAPPPVQDLGVTVATNGTASTVDGSASLSGSVTCTKDATVTVSGTITQVKKGFVARGTYSTPVACTADGPVGWTVTAPPTGDRAFVNGDAQASTQANAFDADYNKNATASDITIVTLKKASA